MKNEYRIVTDGYLGFEVQIRRWWFPVWLEVGVSNTYSTAESAERFAEGHADKVVKYLGRLPRSGGPQKRWVAK